MSRQFSNDDLDAAAWRALNPDFPLNTLNKKYENIQSRVTEGDENYKFLEKRMEAMVRNAKTSGGRTKRIRRHRSRRHRTRRHRTRRHR